MCYNIRCDNSLMVRIAAFQAVGPGSIPGCRKLFFLAKLKKELNDLDPATKNKTLLESIFYWYYSKDLNNKKGDNKGVRLIKKFVFKIYKLMKETCSEEEQDA